MSDTIRDLRRLAKRFKITFRSVDDKDQWPQAHRNTFQDIQSIGDHKFEIYSASIDIRSADEPWRGQTKARAEWLSRRATQLLNQRRNEAGWRFGLEDHVFQRFQVEVACSKCRARIWRSEIEAFIDDADDTAERLRRRRAKRRPCNCSLAERPRDYYETGINPLFEHRTQEVIIQDHLLRSQLPKQEPDRVFGLQMTKNFEELLSSFLPASVTRNPEVMLSDHIKTCPFVEDSEPLLFPFLILEAKSERSSSGFSDTQNQAAFPILALLKLQADLRVHVKYYSEGQRPLVWFFTNRGDAWQVFGCCISDAQPIKYDYFQLWSGSLTSKDKALQLLLIIDYIFDWARDIYRPHILRQLKSIVIDSAFEEVTIHEDNDIFSTKRSVTSWLHDPQSTQDGRDNQGELDETERDSPSPPLGHQILLNIPVHDSEFGRLRSANLVKSQLEGLFITQHNVRQFLRLCGGGTAAKQIVAPLYKSRQLFLLNTDDLNYVEMMWTGKNRAMEEGFLLPLETKFYVYAEFRIFIDTSWTIARELAYLAVTQGAFEILTTYSSFDSHNPSLKGRPEGGRPCGRDALVKALECFSSGASSQWFTAAISGSSMSLLPLPARNDNSDDNPEAEAVGLRKIDRPKLKRLIDKFHHIKKPAGPNEMSIPEAKDLSFLRMSERVGRVSEKDVHSGCERCLLGRKHGVPLAAVPRLGKHQFSDYGLSLVVAIKYTGNQQRNDVCLFALDSFPGISDSAGLATILEDMIQSGNAIHIICQHIPAGFGNAHVFARDTIWNMPKVEWPLNCQEKTEVLSWINELSGHHHPELEPAKVYDTKSRWNYLQLLLHFFKHSKKTWGEAVASIKELKEQDPSLDRLQVYNKYKKDSVHRLS